MSDVVVYTAIYGSRDSFRAPPPLPFDFRIFTDDPQLAKREPRATLLPLLSPKDPIRSARMVKAMPNVFLPNYKTWIWQDSSFLLNPSADLAGLIKMAGEIGVLKHPERTCVYEEAKACISIGLDDPKVISAQMERYRKEYEYPAGTGLAATGILVRQNTPKICRFNADWWSEIWNYSYRDQLSFNVVARRAGLLIVYIGGIWGNPWFGYVGH